MVKLFREKLILKAIAFILIGAFIFTSAPVTTYASVNSPYKLRTKAAGNSIAETKEIKSGLTGRAVQGIKNFKLGSEPSGKVAGNLATETSALTAASLVALDLRGRALGLDKEQIKKVKDRADGIAKRIYTEVADRMGIILLVRVAEGIGRDEVAESFDANDVIVPDTLLGEVEAIKKAIETGANTYKSNSTGITYTIEDAVIDVIEGTNAFVFNVGGKPIAKLALWESGGTSIIATGSGIRSIGNCPDVYADGIATVVPPEKRQDFISNPLDPELIASDPVKIRQVLLRIAKANGITINDMEVLLMDRSREKAKLAVLQDLQKDFPGLEIVQIADGTVAHNIEAALGRKEGKHKVVMTVGGSAEWFFNLDVASIFKELGALTSVRVYSKNVNKAGDAKDAGEATDLERRYAFDEDEAAQIRKLRPQDGEDILYGKKLFTQEDVIGYVDASIAIITHNGVFQLPGVEKLRDGSYKVSLLRFAKVAGKLSRWVEERIITEGELAALLVNETDTVLANLKEKEPWINAQNAITYLIQARDKRYLKAVGAVGTADLKVEPGSNMFQALRKAGKATTAVNVVSYNQIEGHLRALIGENAFGILEVARSQLGYALDENKIKQYIEEIVQNTDSSVPLDIHGDHMQYKAIEQMKILKEEYEKVHGEGSFSDDININSIDIKILRSVQERFNKEIEKERQAIKDINARLIKVIDMLQKRFGKGVIFGSIAIDASTIFDQVAGDIVSNFYLNHGTHAERLVVRLENDFALPLEWGVDFLKLDPESDAAKQRLNEIKDKVTSDMKKRGKTSDEIDAYVKELESAYGALVREARKDGQAEEEVIAAYDKVMREIEQAKIAGVISPEIFSTLSENQKLLLLPASNVEETAIQVKAIRDLLKSSYPDLAQTFGIEVEVGHVDRKVPNPRHLDKKGKPVMEAKMTHPQAVRVMGEYLKGKGLSFDLIATNNGSGHGTEFDTETLTPVSQVGKISPYLTLELQREAEKFGASIAQHGTSGSIDPELTEIAASGVNKFNIATNYQQILLNVLALLDDGLEGEKLMERLQTDGDALMSGLHENTRAKIKDVAGRFKDGTLSTSEAATDSLFMKFMKKTYAWGVTKKKINDSSSKEDIAKTLAKEFKRVFGEMDEDLYALGTFVKSNIRLLDLMAYSESPAEFNNLLSSVKGESNGALVIGANAVIQNSGMLAILKKVKQVLPNFKIAVWTNDKLEAYKLRLMGVTEVADVITQTAEGAVMQLSQLGITNAEDIVAISSDADNDAGNYLASRPGLRVLNLQAPKKVNINDVHLVIARAIATIAKNTEASVALNQAYYDNGQITRGDLNALSDFAVQSVNVPLVRTTETLAKIQEARRKLAEQI